MQNMCEIGTFTAPNFYQVAESNGVPVISLPLPITKSLAISDGAKGIIGLDSSGQMTHAEEQAHLGHELGHCLYGGFYSRITPFDIVERHEVRADHWYIRHAIPYEILFGLLKKGYDTWEIAEQLNTTENYARQAYYYYKDCDKVSL